MTRRIWLIAAIAVLAACGDDDPASPASTSSTSPSTTGTVTLPAAMVTTTTVPASTTVPSPATSANTNVPATSGATCAASPTFDLDGPLRDQFVDYLVACGFTQPEAACLFDHLDFEDPAVLAGDPGAMAPAFDTCQIDIDRMAEIANQSRGGGA